jgi:hypothetical protein
MPWTWYPPRELSELPHYLTPRLFGQGLRRIALPQNHVRRFSALCQDGTRVFGLNPTGRATVDLLHLADDPDALLVRAYWVLAGWQPPTDV